MPFGLRFDTKMHQENRRANKWLRPGIYGRKATLARNLCGLPLSRAAFYISGLPLNNAVDSLLIYRRLWVNHPLPAPAPTRQIPSIQHIRASVLEITIDSATLHPQHHHHDVNHDSLLRARPLLERSRDRACYCHYDASCLPRRKSSTPQFRRSH